MTLFDKALLFAMEKHGGMVRKSETNPYILHPLEAAVIVGTMTSDEEVLSAAVLHDTIEDTNTTFEELKYNFGDRVAELVASETEDRWPELSRADSWHFRKSQSLHDLESSDDIAVKMLWLGDKLSNMRSFYRMWKINGHEIWKMFNQKDPAQQAWYYRTIDILLKELEEFEAWQEYHSLVDTVFADIPYQKQ